MSSQTNLGELLYSTKDKDLPSGESFDKWVMKWWQWLYSVPDEESPVHDRNWNTSAGNQNQSIQANIKQPHPNVLFLTGTFADKAKRTYKVTAKTPILFPIATMAASDAEFPGEDLDTLAEQGNQVENMNLSIVNTREGKKYELGTSDLKDYVVKTGPFQVNLPSDNICYWVPEKKNSTAVSHGYWAFLRGLPEGDYHIKYSQRTKDDPQTLTKNCSYEVEYNLEVR